MAMEIVDRDRTSRKSCYKLLFMWLGKNMVRFIHP